MFCASHFVPHEDCPTCASTVAAMRPTVFAELAAAELCSGTECCRSCDYVFYQAVEHCPRCGDLNPLHVERRRKAEAEAGLPTLFGRDWLEGLEQPAE